MSLGLRVKATVVRAARPYWTYRPASGEGAAAHGGRFNPKGTPALYTSFSFNTAANEVRFGLNADPYTFYFLEVDCADIVDLSDGEVRRKLEIEWSDLECPNWESEMNKGIEPACHAVARRLIAEGYAGAIVNSFANGATPDDLNLVLWTWDDLPTRTSRLITPSGCWSGTNCRTTAHRGHSGPDCRRARWAAIRVPDDNAGARFTCTRPAPNITTRIRWLGRSRRNSSYVIQGMKIDIHVMPSRFFSHDPCRAGLGRVCAAARLAQSAAGVRNDVTLRCHGRYASSPPA